MALHRLRKDLGAASRIKPETVAATAKASKYRLTPPRVSAAKAPTASKRTATNGTATATPRARATRAQKS